MLTDHDIFLRYQAKQTEFEKQSDITLIGHSLFDMWDDEVGGTPKLAGKSVANLGISGISSRQYLDVIVRSHRISHLGENVFIFLGVNDIVKEPDYSPEQVLVWINEIESALRQIAPNARYFLLEATPVNNIATTDNNEIAALNRYLQSHYPAERYIRTWSHFVDQNGNLDPALCRDGLHFNAQGYAKLQAILTACL